MNSLWLLLLLAAIVIVNGRTAEGLHGRNTTSDGVLVGLTLIQSAVAKGAGKSATSPAGRRRSSSLFTWAHLLLPVLSSTLCDSHTFVLRRWLKSAWTERRRGIIFIAAMAREQTAGWYNWK